MHAQRTTLSKEIITEAARSAARVFWTPADVSPHGTDGTTPRYRNTDIGSTRLTYPVLIGGSTTGSPSRTVNQGIISPLGSIGPQWSRNAPIFDVYSRKMPWAVLRASILIHEVFPPSEAVPADHGV